MGGISAFSAFSKSKSKVTPFQTIELVVSIRECEAKLALLDGLNGSNTPR